MIVLEESPIREKLIKQVLSRYEHREDMVVIGRNVPEDVIINYRRKLGTIRYVLFSGSEMEDCINLDILGVNDDYVYIVDTWDALKSLVIL